MATWCPWIAINEHWLPWIAIMAIQWPSNGHEIRWPPLCWHHGCAIRSPFAFQHSSVQVGCFSAVIGPEAAGCRSAEPLAMLQGRRKGRRFHLLWIWFPPRKPSIFQLVSRAAKIRKTTPKASKKAMQIDSELHEKRLMRKIGFVAVLSMRKPVFATHKRPDF